MIVFGVIAGLTAILFIGACVWIIKEFGNDSED